MEEVYLSLSRQNFEFCRLLRPCRIARPATPSTPSRKRTSAGSLVIGIPNIFRFPIRGDARLQLCLQLSIHISSYNLGRTRYMSMRHDLASMGPPRVLHCYFPKITTILLIFWLILDLYRQQHELQFIDLLRAGILFQNSY